MRRYVIFSGANERAMIAVCRYLCPMGLAPVIIARSAADPVWLTGYAKLVQVTRQFDHLEVEDLLNCVAQIAGCSEDELVLLPTVESVNRIVLANRSKFEQAGLSVDLVSEEVYSTVSDKGAFIQLISAFGMLPPPEVTNPSLADLPIVAKPFFEFSRVNAKKCYPELIFSPLDFERFKQSTREQDYFYQRYLNGHSFYYLMYLSPNGQHQFAYQQNLLQQANGKSMLAAAACGCPSEPLREALLASLRSVGFTGFIMVEVMQVESVFYVIEANPRLWGPFDLACRTPLALGLISGLGLSIPLQNSGPSAPIGCYTWIGGLLGQWLGGHKVRRYPGAFRILIKEFGKLRCKDVLLRRDTYKLFFGEISASISDRCKTEKASEVS